MSDIQSAINGIYSYINSGKKNGLDNLKIILNKLEISIPKYKIIHVAGTNGKGSFSVTLEHLLLCAGFNVGKFTSPHILNINERIRLNERDISDEEFLKSYLEVKKVIDAENLTPTFFEIMTAMMFYFFKDQSLDYLVLETGIGGRIDSTNIFDADYAVITNVGFDHVEMLGDSLESISKEKAGIIKPNSQVVVGISDPILKKTIMSTSFKRAIFVEERYRDASFYLDFENFLTKIEIDGKVFNYSLFGKHQFSNFLVAYEVLKDIGVSDKIISENCSDITLQCRFEILKRDPILVLDGAHNSHGIKSLKETLLKSYTPSEIIIITTILKDKDIAEIALNIEELSENIILTSLAENKRGISAMDLKRYFRKESCISEESIHDAVKKAFAIQGKIIVVCGSFYLLSKFKEECDYVWKD